jgi:hypothetical protein
MSVEIWAEDGDNRPELAAITLALSAYHAAFRDLTGAIRAAHDAGVPVTVIARAAGLSRPTVYERLKHPPTGPRTAPQ